MFRNAINGDLHCPDRTGRYRALDAIHVRMPVIVHPDGARTWLDGCEIGTLARLPVTSLPWHAVPRAVGAVLNEGPEQIEPIE